MRKVSYLTFQTHLDSSVKRGLKFDVQSVAGHEGICEEFFYKINVSSLERLTASDIKKLIGGNVTISIAFNNIKNTRQHRYINGLIYRLTELGMSRAPLTPDIWRYEIEVSSWMKKLEFIKDCRIFQKNNTNTIQIVSELLREYGFQDFKSEISRRLPVRDYSVLYNETIANYIRRLLLEDGIFWRYEHHEKKHTLIFHDNSLDLPEIPPENIAQFDAVQSFKKRACHLPIAEYTRASYNWEQQPVKNIKKPVAGNKKTLSHFEYIPNFKQNEEGEQVVSRRCTSLVSQTEIFEGESTIRAFSSGNRFKLVAPTLTDLAGKSFLLKTMTIEATPTSYKNYFTALPGKELFHPYENENIEIPRITGPQTAIVVGEGGNGHVRTQEQGCVKVRFHWDHLSPQNAKHTSAYIRTAMPGAGNRRGMLFIPRIGEEVVVDFKDGNPDKPLIIGSVYSRHNPPPVQPNSKPYQSMIKNSSDRDSNQLVFDDNPNQENLEFVAKKDMNIDVSKDCNIDAVNNINIKARSVFIVTKDTINVVAGNSIENMSLATIINLALAAIMNTACANILDLALGIVLSKSGGLYSQLAGGIIANTSALGIVQASDSMIESTSQALLLNTASAVINSGGESVKTKAGLAILNNASEKINNESDKKTGDALISMTEAKNSSVKGNTKIGP